MRRGWTESLDLPGSTLGIAPKLSRGPVERREVMAEQKSSKSTPKMPPASQLATLLDDLLASNMQGSLTEMTQYLEMKFVNERNPDVQAARMKEMKSLDAKDVPVSGVELEGYSSIATAFEQMVQDVATMSSSIENRMKADMDQVESLSGQVTMLTSRLYMINERVQRKKMAKSPKVVGIRKLYEPEQFSDWVPVEDAESLTLSDSAHVFHRRPLARRLNDANAIFYAQTELDYVEATAEAEAEVAAEERRREDLDELAGEEAEPMSP